MEIQIALSDFTLDELERSNQGHSNLKHISWKQCMLGMWFLLITYRKSYVEIEIVLLDLTLDKLERTSLGHSNFEG